LRYPVPVEILVHGSCVALGDCCVLLRGPTAAGKSDLALRFLFLPEQNLIARPALIADDQVILRRSGKKIIASCPPILSGKIEVRGAGIISLSGSRSSAQLQLVADLDSAAETPRFPKDVQWENILDVPVRRISFDPFEFSAAIKLALILQRFTAEPAG
jgi:HPr kinase/phosphorylase